MKRSQAANEYLKRVPVDGQLAVIIDSIEAKIAGVQHLIDVDHDRESGNDILKLVVYLPKSQNISMELVYEAVRESDRKLAQAGVDFYIAEGV